MKARVLVGLTVALVAFAAVCDGREGPDTDLKRRMAGYYRRVQVKDLRAKATQIPLPLDPGKAANWRAAERHLPGAAKKLLARNGFVVTDKYRVDKVSAFYKLIKSRGLPIFVTSDSLLHLYHVQFDETLRQIEEEAFFEDLRQLTKALGRESFRWHENSEGRGKQAARRCLAYFAVADRLLQLGDDAFVPKAVAKEVRQELELIERHAGYAASPIFTYKEDYSQYVPRGHYTRSENLKKYFKAMMWYGRMVFLIKGKTEKTREALVSDEEARTQTLAAFQIADMLEHAKLADGRIAGKTWDRIYAVTAYYVGFADDLTPWEYNDVFRRMPMRALMNQAGLVEHRWFEVQRSFARLRSPRIYGGTGDMAGPPPGIATAADLDKALEATKGMRFMGQRYVPDSYVMDRLVYPTVGAFTGKGRPFTLSMSPGGPVRGFPRGLDVMAVLGSERAREVLRGLGDDRYDGYDEQLAKLKSEFASVSEADWNRNMYWSWLHCLRALPAAAPEGYPSFMRNAAWLDKQLNAALGSWAQLRHDTILYAKQSYTMRATAMPPRPRMVEGYVEPVPEFYARLLALTRMTVTGLDDYEGAG